MSSQTDGPFRNDDPEHEVQESRAARWFRWFVYGFVALCAGTLIVWALSGKPEREVGVIRAPDIPDRAPPVEDPSRVTNQDQPIYERLAAGTSSERGQELLPPAERPMSQDQLSALLDGPAPPEEEEQKPEEQQTAALSHPAGPAAPGQGEPESVPDSDTPDPKPSTEDGALPEAGGLETVPPPPSVVKQPEAPAAPSFRIQIASVRTPDQAEAEWGRVSNRHPDLLGRLSPFYPTHESGARGTYVRVQAGPLIDKALAELLCSQLKARKVDCFVVEP
ncbi:MAG TPA: SPOR domain-containing protein [Alphaproteobacteria bacterium]|nr:SPOR domain-containing protein [Alphaproteobacteria bacterium]